MRLLEMFNKKAARVIVGLSTVATLSGGMVVSSYAGEMGPPQGEGGSSFSLQDEGGSRLATVEFRACAKDMCMYMKDVAPVMQSKLGISASPDNEIVSGLKTDGSGGMKDGEVVNASWTANGASVSVKPDANGSYKVTAKKMMASIEGKLVPAKGGTQIASNISPPKPPFPG